MAGAAAANGRQDAVVGALGEDNGAGAMDPAQRFAFREAEGAGERWKGKGKGGAPQGHQIFTLRAKGTGKGGKNHYDDLARYRNTPEWALWEQFQ